MKHYQHCGRMKVRAADVGPSSDASSTLLDSSTETFVSRDPTSAWWRARREKYPVCTQALSLLLLSFLRPLEIAGQSEQQERLESLQWPLLPEPLQKFFINQFGEDFPKTDITMSPFVARKFSQFADAESFRTETQADREAALP